MPDSADIREFNFLCRKCASAMFVYFQGSSAITVNMHMDIRVKEVAAFKSKVIFIVPLLASLKGHCPLVAPQFEFSLLCYDWLS